MSSTGPRVWVYQNVAHTPAEALEVEDTDQNWRDLLSEPEVFEDKGDSPAFCGCEFAPEADRRLLKHAIATHCFIFDVDVWRSDRPPFTLDELSALFDGFRFIAYTSYSSTASQTRWRLILPVSPPLPIAKHVPLFRWINKHILDNTVADKVRDATRYGYFKTVASEEALAAYQWHVGQGEYFDWRGLELPDEDPTVVRAFQPGELQQRPEWTPMEAALEAARRRFRNSGLNLKAGENRHEVLLTVGCKLWWDWALNDACVRDVMQRVNANFAEPKSEAELETEIRRAYERVLGEERVEQYMPYGHEREPEARITSAGLEELGKTFRRAHKERRRVVGRALVAMASGSAFTEVPADGPPVLDAVLRELATAFPAETAARIFAVLERSITVQRERSPTIPLPSDEDIVRQLQGLQQRAREAAAARSDQHEDVEAQIIQEAFQLVDPESQRTHRYTTQEIKTWEANGFTQRHWVLMHGQQFFFWVDGKYWGPLDRESANVKGATALWPASAAEEGGDGLVLTTAVKEGGVRTRSASELARDYGTVILERRLFMQPGICRVMGSTLEQSAYRERVTTPAFSERVDTWMQLFAGDQYEALKRWTARFYSVDVPTAALFLLGPRETGKNMFVSGLSRYWAGGYTRPTRAESVRAGLLDSPLLWCDELLPGGWHQGVYTANIRNLVSDETHEVGVGWKRDALVGHVRLVMTGNDMADLVPPKLPVRGPEALAALGERVLMVEGSVDAREYLTALGRVACADMVQTGEIAAHALWLRANWVDEQTEHTRFGTTQERKGVFLDRMNAAISQDDTVRVTSWLATFLDLRGFNTMAAAVNPPALFDEAGLLVHPAYAYAQWRAYEQGQHKGLTRRDVAKVFAALCDGVRLRRTVKGRSINFYALDVSVLKRHLGPEDDWDSVEDALVELAAKTKTLVASKH
jgi:hypothetical protein